MGTEERNLLQMLRGHLQQNKIKEALKHCQDLNARFPENAEGWCAASVIACKLGNTSKGFEFIDRALTLQPENVRFMVAKANAKIQARQLSEAMSLAESVAQESPDNAQLQDMVGGLFTRCENFQRAMDCYERAIVLDESNPTYQFNLATVKRFLGDNEGAESTLDRVIELNPDDFEALHLRSDLRTQTESRNHIAELEKRLQRPIFEWRDEMKLQFSLAKELEDLGQYERSFASLRKGTALRRDHMAYRVEHDLNIIDWIIKTYSPKTFDQLNPGCPKEQAIFIVGLPRTGTTLVDRILSSHTQINSAGELNDFALELTRLARQNQPVNKKQQLVEQSLSLDFSALGEAYLERVGPPPAGVRFIIDKLPLNFLYCGIIHRALPAAKIIHVTRNPMDACYAMYKRLFRDAYPMSYELSDMGHYYLAYRKLMKHWYQLMPDAIYPVSYEDLVTDQEFTTRKLIDHCGLAWQDDCLKFQENPTASMTASASQVRMPVYNSSINKWRKYERQLHSLRLILENEGVNVHATAI